MKRPKGKAHTKARTRQLRRRIAVIAGVAIVLILASIVIAKSTAQDASTPTALGKIKIAGFNARDQYETPCTALMPTCGYCPGDVIAEECYLTQAQFDEYKRLFSLLEAETN